MFDLVASGVKRVHRVGPRRVLKNVPKHAHISAAAVGDERTWFVDDMRIAK